MAIPQGRLSTTLVQGAFLEPEDNQRFALTSHERGPKDVEDTSEGLLYQNWLVTWDPGTGDLTLTPEDFGSARVFANIPNLQFVNFTFDQNARLTYTYVTDVSSFMFWYDTQVAGTVTTDLGADVLTPIIYLDDKRSTQSAANDMLLWFLRDIGASRDLYMARQRDRFLIEELMGSDVQGNSIQKCGMNAGLRIQLQFATL